ncbi:SDR family oxidoreductase [Actinoplanes sp. NPDC049118]|uniref:SDR family NAD(P)-dependent oxidoreductase n=1 Tax=Actinoplanes sp. NPDC049118 TaxID=3155769 RepID=UPI0033D7ACFC
MNAASDTHAYRGRICVVTGAASGIGRALAVQLAEAGAILAISDVDAVGLKETASLLPPGTRARTTHLDVSSKSAVQAYAEAVLAEFGTAHYVFNNAGVTLAATIEHARLEEYEWLLGINLWGPIYGTKAFLPAMLRQGHGHVVNFSSVFGFVTVPTQSAYHISKFGIRGFTECLSRELEGTGVSATIVHPGGIATRIGTDARFGVDAGPAERQFIEKMSALLKTTPEQCAGVILAGVARRKRRIVVGESARVLDLLPRLLPVRYGAVLRRLRGL